MLARMPPTLRCPLMLTIAGVLRLGDELGVEVASPVTKGTFMIERSSLATVALNSPLWSMKS